jgi:S-formylglutathione hydrolase FrmB
MSKGQQLLLAAVLFLSALLPLTGPASAVPPQAQAQSQPQTQSQAQTLGHAECLSMPSRILAHNVAYCVLLPPSYDSEKSRKYPVLYFLHGLGDNEQTLAGSGAMNIVDDLREQHRLGDFLIVTPDGGRSFYVNSRDGKTRYEDFLLQEFIPFIEKRYRIQAGRSTRGIAGVSMGGYGAFHTALQHPELFGSVSAHSALLFAGSPTSEVSGSQGMILGRILGGAFGSPLDIAFWDRNNPFTMVRESNNAAKLKIYFDCGSEDDFGFNVGAQKLHDLLVARKIPHEFHIYPGRHDAEYVAAHLGASLQFESRAFGLGPPE